MSKKYYHRINNLEISLEKTPNSNYIMINKWSNDNSYKWGIAAFYYDDENYWYLKAYYNFNSGNFDWYDFGCLVDLGYKWIEKGCFTDDKEE